MTEMQSRADASYIAAGRRAPPALPLERPEEYRRRLADGVKTYSPRWREANLESINDDALGVIETQIYADAASNGKTAGLRPTEIRPIENRSPAGHTETTFVGGENASFIKQFARPARRAVFADQAEYARDGPRRSDFAHHAACPLWRAPARSGAARHVLNQFGGGRLLLTCRRRGAGLLAWAGSAFSRFTI